MKKRIEWARMKELSKKKNKIEMKMNEIWKRNIKTYKVRKTEWN